MQGHGQRMTYLGLETPWRLQRKPSARARLKIGAAKDEVSSLHSQAGKGKEAMEEDYQKALEVILAYDNKYCMLKHNIYGS